MPFIGELPSNYTLKLPLVWYFIIGEIGKPIFFSKSSTYWAISKMKSKLEKYRPREAYVYLVVFDREIQKILL